MTPPLPIDFSQVPLWPMLITPGAIVFGFLLLCWKVHRSGTVCNAAEREELPREGWSPMLSSEREAE